VKKAINTGKALAELLRARVFGKATVSLVGFSLGTRVIFECLKELARTESYDIIHNVMLLGGAAPSKPSQWVELERVPTGRIINTHTKRDKILAVLYRTSLRELAAGSRPIPCGKIENYDVSEFIDGHMRYRE
jgi:surfactin synthase thioesterase subunit